MNIALKKGVKFFINHEVKKIITKDKKVKSLLIENKNGSEFEKNFDIIISNSDVHFTFNNLLNDDSSKESIKYKKLEPSSSAIVFYWGVKGNYPKLDTHNILFSKNYEKGI